MSSTIIPIHRLPEALRMKALEIDKQGNNNLLLDTEQEVNMFFDYVNDKSPSTNISAFFYYGDENTVNKITGRDDCFVIRRASRDIKKGYSFEHLKRRFDGYSSYDAKTESKNTYYDKNFHKFAAEGDIYPELEITDLNAFVNSGFSENYKYYRCYYYKGHAVYDINKIKRLDDGRFILDTGNEKVYVNKEGDIVDYKTWRTNWEAVKDCYNSLVEGISSLFE